MTSTVGALRAPVWLLRKPDGIQRIGLTPGRMVVEQITGNAKTNTPKGDCDLNTSPIVNAARRSIATAVAGLMLTALWLGTAAAQQAPAQGQFGPRAGNGPAAQQRLPQADVVATHGDWQIQCGEFAAADGQTGQAGQQGAGTGGTSEEAAQADNGAEGQQVVRQCGMIQSVRSKERENIGLTLVLVRTPQGDTTVTMMRILVPIGVFLPTGIALEIDGGAIGRVPFTRCLPQICMAFAEATPETLEKLRKGTVANFIIYEAPGAGLGMEVSLKGFTAAFDQLNQM